MRKLPKSFCAFALFNLLASSLLVAANDVGMGEGQGVVASPRTGKLLRCRSEDQLKKDFLSQLYGHEVYGLPRVISEQSPALADAARYYQNASQKKYQQKKGPNLASNLFSQLRPDRLFNGAHIFAPETPNSQVPRPGDVLLNMTFINPWNVGSFYSKRGMIHARIVVGVEGEAQDRQLVVLDGGWQSFSRLSQIHSQTLWLRPRSRFFDRNDQANLIRWAHVMEPVPYDNRLVDDLAEYRKRLHNALDEYAQDNNGDGKADLPPRLAQIRARNEFLRASASSEDPSRAFAPFGNPDTFIPPSGNYCSEAGSHIFSYLGFRQYGEVPFDMVTAFSADGNLPRWAVYENALTGFGASQGPVYMMHKSFFDYFALLDLAWRRSVLSLPEGYEGQQYNFSKAMKQNRDYAMAELPRNRDVLNEELETLIQSTDTEISRSATELRPTLQALVIELQNTYQNPNLNFTQAINQMFFTNKAYGPNHFLENGDYFELVGVFYNTDLENGYQAKWVVNAGTPEAPMNQSTTLYQIDAQAQSSGSLCEVTNIEVGPLRSAR